MDEKKNWYAGVVKLDFRNEGEGGSCFYLKDKW